VGGTARAEERGLVGEGDPKHFNVMGASKKIFNDTIHTHSWPHWKDITSTSRNKLAEGIQRSNR
jgi:hypothetical protein